jgi:Family of unknown function (DUF5990)
MRCELTIRISVLDPPRGVAMQVQRGRDGLLPAAHATSELLWFEFVLRLGPPQPDGRPNFLGEFAQGPRDARFVYVNSGQRAGQTDSGWDRRAKVSLMGITAAHLEAALCEPDAVLEARIQGTGRDGGPACATVPLLDGGWHVRRSREP